MKKRVRSKNSRQEFWMIFVGIKVEYLKVNLINFHNYYFYPFSMWVWEFQTKGNFLFLFYVHLDLKSLELDWSFIHMNSSQDNILYISETMRIFIYISNNLDSFEPKFFEAVMSQYLKF